MQANEIDIGHPLEELGESTRQSFVVEGVQTFQVGELAEFHWEGSEEIVFGCNVGNNTESSWVRITAKAQ